jgi:chemotaxis protein MotB
MASSPTSRRNEPEPRPVIVKKVTGEHRHVHHGGQWKVAYADFVTAMMAFFMLLWLVSTTDEAKKRGLAEYFSPTTIAMKEDSAGANGLLGGESLSQSRMVHRASSNGTPAIALLRSADAEPAKGKTETRSEQRERFQQIEEALQDRMERQPELRELKTQVRFVETPDGMRIDLVDEADFSMFEVGTDRLVPLALKLVREIAATITSMPNPVIVRGHTDALPYAPGQTTNNWTLSTARAEATRTALDRFGLDQARFTRIEGVADTQPYSPENPYDPRNRRMSITLAWR